MWALLTRKHLHLRSRFLISPTILFHRKKNCWMKYKNTAHKPQGLHLFWMTEIIEFRSKEAVYSQHFDFYFSMLVRHFLQCHFTLKSCLYIFIHFTFSDFITKETTFLARMFWLCDVSTFLKEYLRSKIVTTSISKRKLISLVSVKKRCSASLVGWKGVQIIIFALRLWIYRLSFRHPSLYKNNIKYKHQSTQQKTLLKF